MLAFKDLELINLMSENQAIAQCDQMSIKKISIFF
jgi:hypothetical protein